MRHQQETVTIHQIKVLPVPQWSLSAHGHQIRNMAVNLKANKAIEKKQPQPLLEKYLALVLLKELAQKPQKKIVKFFKQDTLEIFESILID